MAILCHVTENLLSSLTCFSPQMLNTIAKYRPWATPQSLVLCVDLRVVLPAFVNKSTQPNYFATSCSRAKFLFLVTVLNFFF